jgi:hypothetical protein
MAVRHGTRRRYIDGCRCGDCTAANTAYQQRYRQRPTAVVRLPAPVAPDPVGPGNQEVHLELLGPVELDVQDEIGGLAADARPGLAQVARAMARILDNPKAVNQQPAAAKVLAGLLDKLRWCQHAVAAGVAGSDDDWDWRRLIAGFLGAGCGEGCFPLTIRGPEHSARVEVAGWIERQPFWPQPA